MSSGLPVGSQIPGTAILISKYYLYGSRHKNITRQQGSPASFESPQSQLKQKSRARDFADTGPERLKSSHQPCKFPNQSPSLIASSLSIVILGGYRIVSPRTPHFSTLIYQVYASSPQTIPVMVSRRIIMMTL
jgi:hypothetical protein